jgi:hypothetical protein
VPAQEAHEDESHGHVEGVVPGRENTLAEDREQPELDQIGRNRNRARGLDLSCRTLGRQLRPPGGEIKAEAGEAEQSVETRRWEKRGF